MHVESIIKLLIVRTEKFDECVSMDVNCSNYFLTWWAFEKKTKKESPEIIEKKVIIVLMEFIMWMRLTNSNR